MIQGAEGTPVEPDDPWVTAKKELYPAASLTRIAANAKFVVSTVSVVGIALTAFGLVAATSLSAYPLAQLLAGVSAGVALLAVVCALGYLALRLEKRNFENYVEVKNWYQKQFRRAGLVVAASWLLVIAVVLAGIAGVTAAVAQNKMDRPVLSLTVKGQGSKRTVTASVSINHLHPGDIVTLRVTIGNGNVIMLGKTNADSNGSAQLDTTLETTASKAGYRVSVLVGGQERGALQVP
jgi:hypothetical protein